VVPVHKVNLNLLLVIAAHISAVLFYLLVKRENLIHPMLSEAQTLAVGTGRGRAAHGQPIGKWYDYEDQSFLNSSWHALQVS
jgi:hypothetical protein